jgi:hypothetical protein
MNGLSQPQSRLTTFQQAQELGYEHLLFISWPHLIESGGQRLVEALKTSIEDRLQSEGIARGGNGLAHPVFVDKPSLDPSVRWDARIRHALCRSAATLVLVLPTYFQSEFCALEWGITEALQTRRLSGRSDTCFLLLPFFGAARDALEQEFLPPAVRQLNFIKSFDRKKLLHGGKFPNRTWGALIDEIIGETRKIAKRLVDAGPRDWVADQQIAAATGPFNWYPSGDGGRAAAGSNGPQSPPALARFPAFTVEGKAA